VDAVAVAVALALALAPVRPSDPAAQAHFDRATEAFDRGDYDLAVSELQAGYALQPDPAALYAWGQAERMRGNCSRAIELYNVFLASDPPQAAVDKTKSHIELCEEHLRLEAKANDVPVEDAPVPPPRVAPDAQPTAAPAPDRRLDRPGLALLGVGAGLGAIGFPLLGVAVYRAPRVESGPETELDARRRTVRSMYIAGWVFVGLAAASLLGGVIRLAVARKASRRR
jgi:hypothetical protein